jgi:hypothetical protein
MCCWNQDHHQFFISLLSNGHSIVINQVGLEFLAVFRYFFCVVLGNSSDTIFQ